ncbi:MAG: hypothetical protein Q7U54_15635 [Bacteroidales bacterium]|nr:hypothetical protein [Bacteroidales bacterium]
MAIWNTIRLSEIHPDRCDAEYFRKDYQDNIGNLQNSGETSSLGKLFKYINRGSQPFYDKSGTYKALRSVNVGFMNFNETRQEYVTESFFKSNNRGKVQKDDILITSTGVGTLGRTSIWFKDEKAYCDGHITILRNGVIDPYCMTAFLNSKYGITQFNQNYRGSSGQIEIYPYDLSKFIIPKCILPFQTEIGDKLRAAFELQRQSQTLYKKATELLEQVLGLDKIDYNKKNYYKTLNTTCVLERIIDPKFHNPKFDQIVTFLKHNFNTIELRKIADIEYGYMPMQDYELDKSKGIPLIRVTNITQELEIKMDDLKYIPNWVKVPPKKYVEKGDILMVQCGDTTGKVGYIYEDVKNHLFPSFCFSLKVIDKRINSLFLAALLKSKLMQILFDQTVMINTVRPNTTKPRFEKLTIPIFDEDFQLKISTMLIESNIAKKQSLELLAKAKNRVEQLIEEAINKN